MKGFLCILFLSLTFLSCSKQMELLQQDEGNLSLVLSRADRVWNPGVEEVLYFRLKGSNHLELRFPPSSMENVEISPWEPSSKGGTLRVTALKGGVYTFPELKFSTGESDFITLPEWKFRVESLASEGEDIRPDRGAFRLGLLKSWQWALLLFFLFVLLGIFLFISYQKKQKALLESRLSLRLERELASYKKSDPLSVKEGREFYLELTALLRHFLDRVYHLETSGATREEFLPVMLGLRLFRSTEHPWLIQFWEKADRIKFAALKNSPEERKEDYRKLLKILENIISVQKEKEVHEPG